MGLTGKFWAHQYYDVVPDIIVFGKKSQGTRHHSSHLTFPHSTPHTTHYRC
jgi:4-aminobutyrate aminotransferase-like enzyme